jgi:hypothetical protein
VSLKPHACSACVRVRSPAKLASRTHESPELVVNCVENDPFEEVITDCVSGVPPEPTNVKVIGARGAAGASVPDTVTGLPSLPVVVGHVTVSEARLALGGI